MAPWAGFGTLGEQIGLGREVNQQMDLNRQTIELQKAQQQLAGLKLQQEQAQWDFLKGAMQDPTGTLTRMLGGRTPTPLEQETFGLGLYGINVPKPLVTPTELSSMFDQKLKNDPKYSDTMGQIAAIDDELKRRHIATIPQPSPAGNIFFDSNGKQLSPQEQAQNKIEMQRLIRQRQQLETNRQTMYDQMQNQMYGQWGYGPGGMYGGPAAAPGPSGAVGANAPGPAGAGPSGATQQQGGGTTGGGLPPGVPPPSGLKPDAIYSGGGLYTGDVADQSTQQPPPADQQKAPPPPPHAAEQEDATGAAWSTPIDAAMAALEQPPPPPPGPQQPPPGTPTPQAQASTAGPMTAQQRRTPWLPSIPASAFPWLPLISGGLVGGMTGGKPYMQEAGQRARNWARSLVGQQPQPVGATPPSLAAPPVTTAGPSVAGPLARKSALPDWARNIPDPRNKIPVIIQSAQKYGLNPQLAVNVASKEGLGTFKGDKGTSRGVFQLHVDPKDPYSLGNQYLNARGLPLDPDNINENNEDDAIDWVMQWISQHGGDSGWNPEIFHALRPKSRSGQ